MNETISNLATANQKHRDPIKLKPDAFSYRIWQMGLNDCSVSIASNLIVSAQLEGELTVAGDCQYVLFKVTVFPHPLTTSF